jgi:hypothetical protein
VVTSGIGGPLYEPPVWHQRWFGRGGKESARSVNGTCMSNVKLQGNGSRCSPVAVRHY